MQNKVVRKFVLAAGVWLALTTLAAIIGFLIINPMQDYHLAESGLQTTGIVTAIEPENHQIVRYKYSVSGKDYSGSGHGGRGNPAFANITIAQVVIVFYDPQKPETSTLGYPQQHLKVNLAGVIFVAVAIPFVIVLSLLRRGIFV